MVKEKGRARVFPPQEYIFWGGDCRMVVFPCLFPRSGKAVSKLYREKIDQLQAAEQRMDTAVRAIVEKVVKR